MDRSDPRLQRPPSVEALLRRRVIIGFILAVLLTGLIGFLSWRSTRLAAQEADLLAHTHAVMGTLDVTVEHAIELETSARGFALTGQDLLLTHYEAARGTINQDFGTLRHLTTDNPNQQRRLEVLEPQIAAAIAVADELVAERRNGRAIPGAGSSQCPEHRARAARGAAHGRSPVRDRRAHRDRTKITGKRGAVSSAPRRHQGLRSLHARSRRPRGQLECRGSTHQGLQHRGDSWQAHLVLLYSRGSGSRHACAHLTECNRHGPLRGTRITGPQRRLYLLGPRCDPPHLRRLGEAPRFLQSSARRHGAQTGGGSAV